MYIFTSLRNAAAGTANQRSYLFRTSRYAGTSGFSPMRPDRDIRERNYPEISGMTPPAPPHFPIHHPATDRCAPRTRGQTFLLSAALNTGRGRLALPTKLNCPPGSGAFTVTIIYCQIDPCPCASLTARSRAPDPFCNRGKHTAQI